MKKLKILVALVLAMAAVLGVGSALSGAIGIWNFDEGQGGTAYDTSGGNAHGTIHGATWTNDCISGSCLYFDGNDRISVPFQETLTEFSISAWVNVPQTGWLHDTIMATNEFRFQLGGNPDPLPLIGFSKAVPPVTIYGTTITKNEWHHLAVTWDGTEIKLYQDGVLTGSGAANRPLMNINSMLMGVDGISGYPSGQTDYFTGKIDEAQVYNRALSESEIQQLANPQGEQGDANKGHGNDPDGIDDDNPGRGCENKNSNGNRKRCP